MRLGESYIRDNTYLGRRDAFHCPAVLVSSGDVIKPGQRVKFSPDSKTMVIAAKEWAWQGVADPFSTESEFPAGHMFWMLLAPGMVIDLTHHFNISGVDAAASVPQDWPSDFASEDDDGCRGCES